jgi:hypothetical protein
MKILSCTSIAALLVFLIPLIDPVSAQEVNAEDSETATAILDTSIPFAIGAREGDQTIRGSFGWPTFQEGFVEGVYFRFDPDGYARFSTSPRLDDDVFEVTCQNATTICIAYKNGMEIGLTSQGKPQINISGIISADTFFISDRKNELPLPNSVLGPIDQRLETLLSTDGELIIRRELETLQTISLSGFAATVTYLRWVAQNQSSFVFPRGWPTPSQQARQQNVDLTLPDTWVDTRSVSQRAPAIQTTQNLQIDTRLTTNQRTQNISNGNTQFLTRPSKQLDVNSYDEFANSFTQQAQGRSLPADVNRFEIVPGQNYQPKNGNRTEQYNSVYATGTPSMIEKELAILNQSLRNLETKIDNLAIRLSHEIRSIGYNSAGSIPKIYQRQDETAVGTGFVRRNTNAQISEEERIRKRVIESILKQTGQDNPVGYVAPKPPLTGEISVKKNIVERLLEELNGADGKQKEAASPVAKSTNEFISLSDYVNKIMQAEKRN